MGIQRVPRPGVLYFFWTSQNCGTHLGETAIVT